MWRIAQRFFGGEPVTRLVFAKHVENRDRVSSRFDMADIDFAQFVGVFQNTGQLFLKEARFFIGQIESRKFRDVGDVQVAGFGHKLEV